ncbi:hypothetical protein HBHAL_4374 [Halobacillus halophilus DSM 2266]|uniref:Uncharacterized protein n=1 Tax=Halobacillus halophilus (strain ATCC 35676 / DSM 2266 / JCM 20832 / KCTC 3685 / LMG 17431 / NBRC 102448 / NCIMB 2269) TaxID=866895 RepID=I0JRE5_HALH3|nr:hypothetical protein [Halobacillus halophilus]CCG46715.1 hypothetical protein HBHAL_4374 [Halobacillus halophilus DSM 2266]
MKAKRIYRAPMAQRMDAKVKKRVEKGMEPRVVQRDQMPRAKQKVHHSHCLPMFTLE